MSRPADRALLLLALGIVACVGCFVDAAWRSATAGEAQALRARLVRELRLTDLAQFTEARYTRHPSQADLHSAFQDHPLALEHFPTGSLLSPPAALRDTLAADDRLEVSPGGTAPAREGDAR